MERRLYKINEGKMIDGVCGGIAEYFSIDPTIVHVVWALFSMSGSGILAYILCALIIPRQPE